VQLCCAVPRCAAPCMLDCTPKHLLIRCA
jgi:hypothetical protein